MHIKINYTSIYNVEDLDSFMPIYNLLEYSENYSMTRRSLWNCYRDEVAENVNENSEAGN